MRRPSRLRGAQLDWVCSRQHENGWFANAVFTTSMSAPSTHAIAYTMRGLLESFSLTGERRWLEAVLRPAQALTLVLERTAPLPANYDQDWRPTAKYSCLTGTIQLGGVWLRLYQETGDVRWLQAGLRAVEQVAGCQERVHWPPVRGAIAGSFPVWGRYAPLQYPNWATKFLADGLMLYDDCLNGSTVRGVGSVAPGPREQPTPASTFLRPRPCLRLRLGPRPCVLPSMARPLPPRITAALGARYRRPGKPCGAGAASPAPDKSNAASARPRATWASHQR